MNINNTRFNSYREETLKKFQERKEQYEKELYILRSIKRAKKKDGSDYQSFIKNFSYPSDVSVNYDTSYCIVGMYIVFSHAGEKVAIANYTTDSKFVETVDPDRIVREPLLKDRVYYTPDEFLDKIQKEIEWREDALAELTLSIVQFDATCGDLWDKIEPLLDYIKNVQHEAYALKELAIRTINSFTDYI